MLICFFCSWQTSLSCINEENIATYSYCYSRPVRKVKRSCKSASMTCWKYSADCLHVASSELHKVDVSVTSSGSSGLKPEIHHAFIWPSSGHVICRGWLGKLYRPVRKVFFFWYSLKLCSYRPRGLWFRYADGFCFPWAVYVQQWVTFIWSGTLFAVSCFAVALQQECIIW